MAKRRRSSKAKASGARASRTRPVPKKPVVLKDFSAGAWAGACFGLASTILVTEFTLKFYPTPVVVAIFSALLDALLLVGGVVGFTLFRQFAKNRSARKQ